MAECKGGPALYNVEQLKSFLSFMDSEWAFGNFVHSKQALL